MYCTNCGNKLNTNHRFCTQCGNLNRNYQVYTENQNQPKGNNKYLFKALIFLLFGIIFIIIPCLVDTFIFIGWLILIVFTLGLILLVEPNPSSSYIPTIYIVFFSISAILFIISIVFFVKYFKSRKVTQEIKSTPDTKKSD